MKLSLEASVPSSPSLQTYVSSMPSQYSSRLLSPSEMTNPVVVRKCLLKKLVQRKLKSFMEEGRSMTTFYYRSVNHQSGLQSKTFSELSYLFLIHENVPQIMSFHLRYMVVRVMRVGSNTFCLSWNHCIEII